MLNICVVVTGKTIGDFLSQLEKAQVVSDIIELRIDCLNIKNLDMVQTIKNHTYKKAILCCRAKADGGNFLGSSEMQQEILQTGNEVGFNYLDIDLSIARKMYFREKKAKIIISYHNFLYTPTIIEFNHLLKNMRLFKPDVFKFATKTKTYEEVKVLFNLLASKNNHENMIVLGMGERGKIIRLFSPLLGGYLTFASINESISAPGQIDLKIMKDFYRQYCTINFIPSCPYRTKEVDGDFSVQNYFLCP